MHDRSIKEVGHIPLEVSGTNSSFYSGNLSLGNFQPKYETQMQAENDGNTQQGR